MEIKREKYFNQLLKYQKNGRVKIITGIRRCGKTYLIFNLFYRYLLSSGIRPNHIISVALDEIVNIELRNPMKLNKYIQDRIVDDEQYYVLIDEIQEVKPVQNPYLLEAEDLIGFAEVVIGLSKKPNVDVYITGSNSKMLSKDVVTEFRDRGDEIHMEPLTYQEFYEVYSGEKRTAWRDYCTYGGLPRILQLDTHEEKSLYLQRLLDETYIKDVIDRNKIRNDKKILDDLLNVIASNIGGLTNSLKLSSTFNTLQHVKVNHTTISNYLDYFEDAYIIEKAQRYDVKGKKYLNADAKYYFTDLGLRNAKINFRQTEINHIMENIVYNELRNRGYSVDVGVVTTYSTLTTGKRERRDLELDFISRKIDQTIYIQSALTLESEGKKEQESKSLIHIRDGFKKVLITGDNVIPHYDENGFFIINIEDFLLDNNSLNK